MRTLAIGLALLLGTVSSTWADDPAHSPVPPPNGQIEQVGAEIRARFESPAAPEVTAPVGIAALVWSQEIHYPGATYIAPHFERFSLPPGARLVVRHPQPGVRSWTYTGLGKAGLGAGEGFWGIHIPGDRAVLELHSDRPLDAGVVTVDSFAYGFSDLDAQWGFGPGAEALCGPDDSQRAQCYTGSEPAAYDRGRAVARLLINGTGACTGWLVGSAGHLMTNEHCIGSASDALNTDYEFMAEGACGTFCESWFACPGTVVATSATLVQLDAALDYALVQLPTNPTATYGFLQLRPAGASLGERIYIPQHPAAWGKRIALASSHPSNPAGVCEVDSVSEPACSGGPPDVGYYCDTQGGSSGSPVLGYGDHLVVALHHCRGAATCTSSGGDPNRGVPIEDIIADLGGNLPPDALGGGTYSCEIDVTTGVDTCDDGIVTATSASGSQRVTRVDLGSGFVRLDVFAEVCTPTSWWFHVADSPTANGYGGDGGTTRNDAEAHAIGGVFDFYGRDFSGVWSQQRDVVAIAGCSTVQWTVMEDVVHFDDDANAADAAKVLVDTGDAFELAPYAEYDAEDPSEADADLWYVGLNRTVGSSSRTGSGLNRACFVLSDTPSPDPTALAGRCGY